MMNAKQEQIIKGAIEEFSDAGFENARMNNIAAWAEVSKRTVYKYFDGKEALFHAIVDRLVSQLDAGSDLRFDPARPLRQQLWALAAVEGKLFVSRDFMDLVRLVAREAERFPGLAVTLSARIDKRAAFRRFFADAASAGALKAADPALAADQFLGLLKADAFWPRLHGGGAIDEAAMRRTINGAVDLIVAGYGAKTAAV